MRQSWRNKAKRKYRENVAKKGNNCNLTDEWDENTQILYENKQYINRIHVLPSTSTSPDATNAQLLSTRRLYARKRVGGEGVKESWVMAVASKQACRTAE